jgi:NADH-quinone oxidoreductase subunit E
MWTVEVHRMLTEEERKEIDTEVRKYRTKRAAGPEALKIVQKRRRWISDDSLRDVARYLDMTTDELDSVATCYNFIFRKPVGKHVILVCDSVTCWIMGHENLLEHIEQRLHIKLGQTTGDGRFTLLPAACLGACEKAPAMMVNDRLYGKLTPARIDEVLDQYR